MGLSEELSEALSETLSSTLSSSQGGGVSAGTLVDMTGAALTAMDGTTLEDMTV